MLIQHNITNCAYSILQTYLASAHAIVGLGKTQMAEVISMKKKTFIFFSDCRPTAVIQVDIIITYYTHTCIINLLLLTSKLRTDPAPGPISSGLIQIMLDWYWAKLKIFGQSTQVTVIDFTDNQS